MTTYAHQPIEVYLRQDEYDALQELATMRGVPLAELVHEGVEAVLHRASEAVDPTAETLTAEGPPDGDPLRDIIGMIDSDDQAEAAWPLDIPIQQHPLWGIVDLGDAGVSDLAEHHDRYLVEFEMESNRRWPEKFS